MKAIRMHGQTGVSGLVYEEAPDATPMACDVLVKVAACGITHNELDYPIFTCRAGHPRTLVIPGAEVSGRALPTGHYIPEEAPDLLASELEAFFA